LPDIEVKLHEVISQGHAAAVRWSVSATHAGKGFDLEPTGRTVEFHGVTWVHIDQGKIVEGWDSWDLGGLMQQLSAPNEGSG
jgi:predicted ester cyclase